MMKNRPPCTQKNNNTINTRTRRHRAYIAVYVYVLRRDVNVTLAPHTTHVIPGLSHWALSLLYNTSLVLTNMFPDTANTKLMTLCSIPGRNRLRPLREVIGYHNTTDHWLTTSLLNLHTHTGGL